MSKKIEENPKNPKGSEYTILSETLSAMVEFTSFTIKGYPKPYGFSINLTLPKGFKLHGTGTHAINTRGWELIFLRDEEFGKESERQYFDLTGQSERQKFDKWLEGLPQMKMHGRWVRYIPKMAYEEIKQKIKEEKQEHERNLKKLSRNNGGHRTGDKGVAKKTSLS